jgi:hypothetical protein
MIEKSGLKCILNPPFSVPEMAPPRKKNKVFKKKKTGDLPQ